MGEVKNFGRYQVKQLLGQGAMGLVYLAEDPVIGREVAVKVIEVPPGQNGPGLQARFEREFRSAGTLSHPNIVTIHDVGTEGARTFIAMEYVRGESLEAMAASKRLLSLETVADLLDQICSGLDYAHERGIVHRDIKPANIIFTPDGRPKITDFGVAKVLDSGTVAMTQEGAAIGTPSYMAPEQAKGHPVKGTADQFSVAVIVYRLLTGECPFMGESWSTIMYKVVHEDPIALNVLNRTVPAGVNAAVMKALGKDPAQRFPTCSAFAAAVRSALAGGSVERRDRPNAAVAATVVLDRRAAAGAGAVVVERAGPAGPLGSRQQGVAVRAGGEWPLRRLWCCWSPPSGVGYGWRHQARRAGHLRCENRLAGPGRRCEQGLRRPRERQPCPHWFLRHLNLADT